MKVLLTAFQGTSSEKLVLCFGVRYSKLILANSKSESVKQLIATICADNFDYIISFGQKPVIKDKTYIELQGKLGNVIYQTDFETDRLASVLTTERLPVRFSKNAGTSFCNHLYASGLQYISQSCRQAKMVFIHVPFEKNISDFNAYSHQLIRAIDGFVNDQ